MDESIYIMIMGVFLLIFVVSFRAAEKLEKKIINSDDDFLQPYGTSKKN